MKKENIEFRPHVHIVLSDRGWIIEECARQLTDRLPYITVGTEPDTSAVIQYYMTYSARKNRVSPIEVALFTHREEEPNANRLFNEAARTVDHAIAMSNATEKLIEQLGVGHHSCISPGVDLDNFRPRLAIGVVGRTYHTGRKGEALVRAVMDIPDIDWHFTGEGWPGPSQPIAQTDLPAFYRSMDYVLVPATNEGGPMSVLEALSCGTPVIASDVGWATEFPHIPFTRGDAGSLREVLEGLRAERFMLQESVSEKTWANWAAAHDALFADLVSDIPMTSADTEPIPAGNRVKSVALVTHGAEDSTLGGPSVRVPRTRDELSKLGLRVTASNRVDMKLGDADIVHGFNIWSPVDAYRMAQKVDRLGRSLVFSPILLDLAEAPFWQADLLRVFRASSNSADAERRLDNAFADFLEKDLPPVDFEPGYSAALRAINDIAAATIFLSDSERALFERITGTSATNPHLVRNPVDAERFDTADPDLFRQTYGLGEYVLCIGRLEHRKNQLMLANALASTGLPLVLIGHEADAEYGELIRRFGGPNLHIIGRIDPESPLLSSAIAGARVFTLPSWAEGAPLAALEAAAAGKTMVLSNRSSEREYFGSYARYCDPSSSRSIREEILAAWHAPRDEAAAAALRQMVRDHYDWKQHARETQTVYESVPFKSANAQHPQPPPALSSGTESASPSLSGGLVFDITTWANNANTLSGIVRVECSIARALLAQDDIPVRFVLYHGFGHFIEIHRSVIENDSLKSYVSLLQQGLIPETRDIDLTGFTDFVTVGSSWMQNATYVAQLYAFTRSCGLRLNVLMHDFTPYLFPQWYDQGYADIWSANCRAILAHADRILVYSQSTARDTEEFCLMQDVDTPAIAKIRLADEIGDFAADRPTHSGSEARAWFGRRPFILAVGGIHARKNYGLLYDVWTMLRQSMGDQTPHLVIVGGVSWNGQDAARAIQEDRRVNTHIHILQDIDDDTLGWLYRNCLFTVYPSLYEGWGLPIGESLARGKICLASSTSSMVEIAPELTDLLSPFDRSAWAARVEHYARSPSSRAQREAEIKEGFAITHWSQTTDDLLFALHTLTRPPTEDKYLPGALSLCNGGPGSRFLRDGWYPAEKWGAWSGHTSPSLALQLATPPTGDMVLTILAQVLKEQTGISTYRVVVNDVVCGSIQFYAEREESTVNQSVSRLLIPQQVLARTPETRITFETDEIISVRHIDPDSPDDRKLGLGLSAFMLEPAHFASDAPLFFSTRPEIRDMLDTPVDQNLARMLADYPGRPCLQPEIWTYALGNFVRSGTSSCEGAASVDDLLILAIGTARLRLAQELHVDLLIEQQLPGANAMALNIFANNEHIALLHLDPGSTLCSITVPVALLGKSDPLQISFAGTAPFVLRALRARHTTAPSRIRVKDSAIVDLSEQLLGIACRDTTDRAAEVDLAIADVDANSVLAFEFNPFQGASITCNGTTASIVAANDGRAFFSLAEAVNAEIPLALSLRLTPGAGGDVQGAQCRVQHLHLPPLHSPKQSGALQYIPLGPWNEIEDDGTLWAASDTASFLVRPGNAGSLKLRGEVLYNIQSIGKLGVSIDGLKVDAQITSMPGTNQIKIFIMFPASNKIIRHIDIYGLSAARPCDIGINSDVRNLSIRFIDFAINDD